MPSYCAEQVRHHDHDRYLTCLFAPSARREHLFALYAFNLEVAKTAEVVSEPMLGRIRLQWWRDAIAGIYAGQAARHDIIAPLAHAVREAGLTRGRFDRLIDAREADLEPEPPESLVALEDYAEATSSALVLLALEILGARGGAVETAGRHAGLAWALTGLIRAVPFHARQKRLYLPRDLVVQEGLKVGDVFELRSSAALCRVAEGLAVRAKAHLRAARAVRRDVPKEARSALLLAGLAARELQVLHRWGFDPFHPRVQARRPGGIWRLAWAHVLRRY